MISEKSLVTENLALWSSAIEKKSTSGKGSSKKIKLFGIQRLRDLILDLAFRGLLIQQDQSDEPASVLIEKIRPETARIAREGKFSEHINSKKIDTELHPEVPASWEWCELGEIAAIARGGSPRPIKSFITEEADGLNWIKIGDSERGSRYITSTGQKIKPEGLVKTRQVHPGDLILSNSMSFGYPYILKISGCIHDGWLVLRLPEMLVDKLYLCNLFLSPYVKRAFTVSASGAVVQNLNADKVKSLVVPLPPLKEQHRIVAKVDELMTLCDQLEQQQEASISAHETLVETLLAALTNAADKGEFNQAWERIADNFDTLFTTESSVEQLKETILHLAVMGKLVPPCTGGQSSSDFLGECAIERQKLVEKKQAKKQKALAVIDEADKPFMLPVTWEWARLSDFALVGTGATPSRSNTDYYDPAAIDWMTSAETADDFVWATKEKISCKALAETNVTLCPVGTLVMAMYGQGKTRGQVTELMIEAGTNQACATIQLLNDSSAHRRYIKYFFAYAYEQLRSVAAGGAQPNLNLSKVSNTVVPIPPLAEQKRIVAKLDQLLELCSALSIELVKEGNIQVKLADAIAGHSVL